MHPIVGIAVPDERPLAGRIVGWMFFVGAMLTTLLPLLPGANGEVVTPTLPIGIGAGIWGLWAAVRMDWRTRARLGHPCGGDRRAVCAAVAASDTGGANSPARFLLMLGVVFAAYFFPPREAWPYLGLAIALHALPLAYDHDAIEVMGELLILGPMLLPAGVPADHGKRGMVEAQTRADTLARRDPLTGFANRRALVEAIACRRTPRRAADARRRRLQGASTPVRPSRRRPGAGRRRRLPARRRAARVTSRRGSAGTSSRCSRRGSTRSAWRRWPGACWRAMRRRARCAISAGFVVGAGGRRRSCCSDADEALAAAKGAGKDRALSYAS